MLDTRRDAQRVLDTRRDAQRVLDDIVRRQTPAQRLAIAIQWSDEARELALQALRDRYPTESVLTLVERMTGQSMVPAVRSGPPHR